MKPLLFLMLGFFWLSMSAQGLQIDTSTYTKEELVEFVLLNGECSVNELDNINSYGSHLFTFYESMGYFTNDNPIIPFESGIIMTTGNVEASEGPNAFDLSDGNTIMFQWQGDTDLFNYITAQNIDPVLDSYNNASILEFDFVPVSDFFSFNYIFLSEEYGVFQCEYSDAFAFFLTDLETDETINLATVPETTIPVSVLTIRDDAYNDQCSSVNEEYFNNYYENYFPIEDAPHNYNGDTKPLVASADVIPGRSYRIKLVIADRNDGALDSAVMIESGSFNSFSLDLGEDQFTCDPVILEAPDYLDATYEWSLDNVIIPDETSNTLLANQTGLYSLTVYIGTGNCSITDEIYVNVTGVEINDVDRFQFCDEGNTSIDLNTLIDDLIPNPATVNYVFYETENDAENETNPITNPENYPFGNNQIWIRVEPEDNENCYGVFPIEIVVAEDFAFLDNSPFVFCDINEDGVEMVDLQSVKDLLIEDSSQFNIDFYLTLNDAENNQNPIPTTQFVLNNDTQLYFSASLENTICREVNSFLLQLAPLPQLSATYEIKLCDIDQDDVESFDLQSFINEQLNTSDTYYIYEDEINAEEGNTQLAINNLDAYMSDETMLYVQAVNANDCTTYAPLSLVFTDQPVFDLSADHERLCVGETTQVHLNGYDSANDYTWLLQDGTQISPDNNETLTLNSEQAGEFLITVLAENPEASNCTYEQTVSVTFVSQPVITEVEINNGMIEIDAIGTPPIEYSLDGETWQETPIFHDLETGIYTIYVRSADTNCTTSRNNILILEINNVITNNGDDLNSQFIINNLDIFVDENQNIIPSTLQIYDRYGKLVHEEYTDSAKPDLRWNGTLNGVKLNTADYWYVLKLADGRQFAGHITVKNY